MKQNRIVPWWESLGVGARPLPDTTDAAGMGTAFGLDASMAQASAAPEDKARAVTDAPSSGGADPQGPRS
jgi:hypothetical protein